MNLRTKQTIGVLLLACQVFATNRGVNVTGEVPVKPRKESMPLEDLKAAEKATGAGTTPTPGLIQFVPVPILPAAPQAPAAPPGPAAPAPPSGSPPATGAASGAGAPQR